MEKLIFGSLMDAKILQAITKKIK
ncbi:uncharacterized protein METZ01_LOCUS417461 [marine metagenome]|uniref:Uncharacterized protein n=1 Tax=marine metagenome TaxID=408172 RepID=A0A382X089_9ZZZZ